MREKRTWTTMMTSLITGSFSTGRDRVGESPMKNVNKERKRRRRDQRIPKPNPIQLTERDLEILQDIYENRVLSSDQIFKLHFGTKTATNARLAKLFDHQYLARHILPSRGGFNGPLYYSL